MRGFGEAFARTRAKICLSYRIGLYTHVPHINIRYVKERGEFGYTTLSNCFYAIYDCNREIKEETINDPDYINGVKVTAPAGLYLRWMEGKSDKANKLHGEFKNPLEGINCKDAWGNIWKD